VQAAEDWRRLKLTATEACLFDGICKDRVKPNTVRYTLNHVLVNNSVVHRLCEPYALFVSAEQGHKSILSLDLVSEIAYSVLMGTLNPAHSLFQQSAVYYLSCLSAVGVGHKRPRTEGFVRESLPPGGGAYAWGRLCPIPISCWRQVRARRRSVRAANTSALSGHRASRRTGARSSLD